MVGMQIDVHVNSPEWHQQETPHGLLTWRGYPTSVDELAGTLASVAAGNTRPAIADLTGHWSAILQTPSGVVAAQDVVRSWPIFIVECGADRFLVTEDIETATAARATAVGSKTAPLDPSAVDEFLNLGYVTGEDTLFTGITQVQSFEARFLPLSGEPFSYLHPVPRHDVPGIANDDEADAVFSQGLTTVLDRMFAALGEQQIVLPLSGGLDSRLLAVELKDRGYEDVVAFTYGVAETAEVQISREVAEAVGYRWEFIQFTPEEIREAWATPEAADFIRESYAGSALPHVQDWYALRELKRRGLIEDGAIFLPGHTVVGAMHNEEVMDYSGLVTRDEITDLILEHHSSIRPGVEALLENDRFIAKIDRFLEAVSYNGTRGDRLMALEYWNVLERQTKYINNSVRAYEHFGYRWALPMYDKECFSAWFRLSDDYTLDREWYRRFVNRRYEATTGKKISTYEGFAAANIAQSKRDKVKSVLRALGLLTFVERKIRAQAVANHPMALNEFIGTATAKDLQRYVMRGGSPLGLYAEQFIADTWNPHVELFAK